MKKVFLIPIITGIVITLGVWAIFSYHGTYAKNCESGGGFMTGFLSCTKIIKDFINDVGYDEVNLWQRHDTSVNSEFCNEQNTSIDKMKTEFPIKQPYLQSFPANYDLRGIEQYQNGVVLYYADYDLCNGGGNPLEQVSKGTILVSIDIANSVSANDFANQLIERIQRDKSAKMMPHLVDINGKAGVGWESFDGTDMARINNTVIANNLAKRPAQVIFYDESGKTQYAIVGMRSMHDLLTVAKSIP